MLHRGRKPKGRLLGPRSPRGDEDEEPAEEPAGFAAALRVEVPSDNVESVKSPDGSMPRELSARDVSPGAHRYAYAHAHRNHAIEPPRDRSPTRSGNLRAGSQGSSRTASPEREVLLNVEVNIDKNDMRRLVLYKGQNPKEAARDFARTHGLPERLHRRLCDMLEAEVAKLRVHPP